MAKSYERNTVPPGYTIADFVYKGDAADTQTQFDGTIGLADMIQFDLDSEDESNEYFKGAACSYYHAGVLQHPQDNTWWVYFEWGRVNNALYSWTTTNKTSTFQLKETSDYIFRICDSETDARAYFKKKCAEKNSSRIVQENIGGVDIWVPKGEKRGYIVQKLAQRMRGLPNAYTKVFFSTTTFRSTNDPVLQFARDMSGGSIQYAQTLIEKGGAIPTLDSIQYVKTELIPAALRILSSLTPDNNKKQTPKQRSAVLTKQLNHKELIDLSEYTATFIPRPIPMGLSKQERKDIIVLTENNITDLRHDLDVFENLLLNSNDSTQLASASADELFGATLTWIDPSSSLWKWLEKAIATMTNNRHFRNGMKISNIFSIERPHLDEAFNTSVATVAKKRKGRFSATATLQPNSRPDMIDYNGKDTDANVYLGIHGTRAVNVMPILRNNLQRPQFVQGAHITGYDFGYGIYFATDWKKSYGYVGADDSRYVRRGNEGRIKGRQVFLFLSDVIMGEPYQATGTGSWKTPPKGFDSIAMFPRNISSLQNDEYTIFDESYQRIRYLIEFTLA